MGSFRSSWVWLSSAPIVGVYGALRFLLQVLNLPSGIFSSIISPSSQSSVCPLQSHLLPYTYLPPLGVPCPADLLSSSPSALPPPSSPRPPSALSLCPPPSLPLPPRSLRPALLRATGMPPLHKRTAFLSRWFSQSLELVGFLVRVSHQLTDPELCSSTRKTRADRFGSFISTAGQKLGSPGMGRE